MIACPGCGANLRFDIASQKMKCSYCEGLYDPYDFDTMQDDAEREPYFDAWIYSCPSCGAELMTTDETDATAFCPYCGGASILFDRLRQVSYPSHIIPFQIDKKECRRAYLKAARKAVFTPSRYKKPEFVKGFRAIYMPYWSYRVEQKGKAKVDAEDRASRDGDYLVTEQYSIVGDVDITYDRFAHDASRAFDDEISECLAPFDTKAWQPFTPGFLSGFYVDVADEPSEKYLEDAENYYRNLTAEKLLKNSEVNRAAREGHVHTTGITGVSIPTRTTDVKQVFYPVWFMSYRDGDRITYASVNGQNGKVVADFPISPLRFLIASLLVSALVFLVLNLFFTLKPEWALILSSLLLLLGVIMSTRQLKRLESRLADKKAKVSRGAYLRSQRPVVVLTVLVLLAAAAALVIDPVYNTVFYTVCMVEAMILFFLIYKTFRFQLELASRRPPQFNKKGADDDA